MTRIRPGYLAAAAFCEVMALVTVPSPAGWGWLAGGLAAAGAGWLRGRRSR